MCIRDSDRTSPGEIEEILKRFHGTRSVSYTHLDVYKRQLCNFMFGSTLAST